MSKDEGTQVSASMAMSSCGQASTYLPLEDLACALSLRGFFARGNRDHALLVPINPIHLIGPINRIGPVR